MNKRKTMKSICLKTKETKILIKTEVNKQKN